LPGCPFAEDDPAFAQIVWRHLDVYAVSNDRSDSKPAHFTGCVGDDAVLIIQGHAEASVWHDIVDHAFQGKELLLRQYKSLAYEKSSARTCSGAEPTGMKWKRCRICIVMSGGQQYPSQATLGNIHITRCKKITSTNDIFALSLGGGNSLVASTWPGSRCQCSGNQGIVTRL